MYSIRLFVSRHARVFEVAYNLFSPMFTALEPVWRGLGYKRMEAPFQAMETVTKGLLFDCRMCGRCVLSATGMACPMNCPKELRNGPCGGVRANGNCEVEPEMRCVWVEAWEGSRMMRGGDSILALQAPVDRSIGGSSAWLRFAREHADQDRPGEPTTEAAS